MLYKEKEIDIEETNYKKLFIEKNRFKRIYKTSNEEVLEKYDYYKYIKNKNTQIFVEGVWTELNDPTYIKQTQDEMESQEKNMNLMHDTVKE